MSIAMVILFVLMSFAFGWTSSAAVLAHIVRHKALNGHRLALSTGLFEVRESMHVDSQLKHQPMWIETDAGYIYYFCGGHALITCGGGGYQLNTKDYAGVTSIGQIYRSFAHAQAVGEDWVIDQKIFIAKCLKTEDHLHLCDDYIQEITEDQSLDAAKKAHLLEAAAEIKRLIAE